MQERRTAQRKRSFLKGTAYFNNRQSSMDCVVRDFSDTGARLEFGGPVTLPDVIELHIPSRDETVRAQIRWRSDLEIGVSFGSASAPAKDPAPATSDIGRRVDALEHEVAKLHRLVVEVRGEVRKLRGED